MASIEDVLSAAYRQKQESVSECQRITCLRDIAVSELLFAASVHVSKPRFLSSGNVRLEEGEIKIYGKGAKERYVQIASPSVLQALGECRKEVSGRDPFFINRLRSLSLIGQRGTS